ncbi:MAG: low-specificity L-threonine aldolase [Synergistaceae bacterium]|nr:low-specificity L-threonine aldolase [Synergistaceae bacterium]
MEYLDFRSDTVTKPTEEMRAAMASAEVGDDVYGDDPTVNELQDYAACLTGMEAALYVCSGTMGNLVSLMSHCARGEGVLMGTLSHTWKNEAGNAAFLAGVMPYPLDDLSGLPSEASLKLSYQPEGNVHCAHTVLLTLENTHNAAGGLPADERQFANIAALARDMGLKIHVDGARIFNAVAYFGNDVKDYTRHADSIQICLSKGLGAPMGSVVCGTRSFVEKARKYRKALGGGQRQTGIAAAAGLIALKSMRARLADDHKNAAVLAEGLASVGYGVEKTPRRTNMVYFGVGEHHGDARTFARKCAERGLLVGAAGKERIRMVTHIGLDEKSVADAINILKEINIIKRFERSEVGDVVERIDRQG